MSRILVVDDDPGLRQLYQKVLAPGIRGALAASGAEALLVLEMAMPDLIMLDLAMPDMDGISLLRVIRRCPRVGRLPVIVLAPNSRTTPRLASLRQAERVASADQGRVLGPGASGDDCRVPGHSVRRGCGLSIRPTPAA